MRYSPDGPGSGNRTGGDNYLYAVVDMKLGRFDLRFGVGHGNGGPEDRRFVKAVLEVSIDPRQG